MIARGIYRISTVLAAPFIARYMKRRLAEGKEDPDRFPERHGKPGLPRPDGPLVWIHAASNGEAMSALPLINRILARDPAGHVLLTTGTVTSARLMADKLPTRAIHQFIPVDRSAWVKSFLAHWRPDAGIWVESEFWPALIWEMRAAGKPVALVNGRISKRSLARWRQIPGIAADLLAGFSPCLAQSPDDADHLRDLGARDADYVGNLKLSVPPLSVDEAALTTDHDALGARPVWVAASTHPGEEDIIADTHEILRKTVPDVITILVPRHPKRGAEITERLAKRGLTVAQRSLGQAIANGTDILVADTVGELGLFFRLARIAFIGGSLRGNHGGHNPIEAARLGCAPLYGPDMSNFSIVAADLDAAKGAITVKDAQDLASQVAHLLTDEQARSQLVDAAQRVAGEGEGAADRVLARLEAILPPITPAPKGTGG
jgi:3-deoxy-D-manno-octulosonic-acid transferase